ncbi:xanthine dehydrogenase accessory protein XdhC [Ramlibacter solisilvae]|uniref:Xanthine dehydrogenase n=1 Tax=Ramlibacter tataouinensis TaxID=94132 RepID=A0A127JR12_9BURK|nr:xanthine dehydrogenase accessory protein XdhC [Ramlibacter tataouinensis]AMO22407.1 xanthine dehydrogenase [Ramlibacter tataouinensis]
METLTRQLLSQGGVLVTVTRTQGSAPREPGAWMWVFSNDVVGTVGGGHLEFEAIAHARALLAGTPGETQRRYTLGPSLGQCCGGAMELSFERVDPAEAPSVALRLAPRLAPLALFGGGHVGRAIVQALAPLPYRVTWIDSRDEIFPPQVPANIECEHSDPVHAAVRLLPAQSRVLVMSFSHAEDLDVVAACLARLRERDDLPYVGLIGSQTKWATFRHRLEQRGFAPQELARIICPIGIAGIGGKQPAVIAASAVAQILQLAPP